MQRRAGSSGQTTASRIKSLYAYVQSEHGPADADAFLLRTKLDRDYLSDETRLMPIELWHTALVAFASRFGREAIAKTAPHVVGADNLGVWTHVLRGADSPGSSLPTGSITSAAIKCGPSAGARCSRRPASGAAAFATERTRRTNKTACVRSRARRT